MSSLVITRTVRENGNPIDATSAILRDASATYGVRRQDTHEIVVPAGTAMTRIAAGVYTYTIANAAPGNYEYAVEVLLKGSTYRASDVAVVEVVTNLAAYMAPGEARALAASVGMTAVATMSDAELAPKLAIASLDVDHAWKFQGRKYDPAQTLEFPRVPYPTNRLFSTMCLSSGPIQPGMVIWAWDSSTGTAVVPMDVKLAVIYQIEWNLKPEFADRVAAIQSGLASQGNGSVSESYVRAADLPGGLTGLSPRSQKLMERYRLRSGRLL